MRRTKPQRNFTVLEGNPALAAWPVNSIFFGYTSTNPATLLGGGTWVQIAQGRCLIGQNPSDTDYDVLGETGGSKTHMITESEVPDHQHYAGTYSTSTDGSHQHGLGFQYLATTSTGGTALRVTDINNQAGGTGTGATAQTNNAGGHSHSVNNQSGVRVGGSGQTAMDIRDPYLVVYIWRRTA